jgi:hypothetical protein
VSPLLFGLPLALALVLVPDAAIAARPEVKAAEFAAQAQRAENPDDAAIAALQAHNLWRRAYDRDGSPRHLCNARALLSALNSRTDLDPEHRALLEQRRAPLRDLDCAEPRAPRTERTAGSSRNATPTIGVPPNAGRRPLQLIELRPPPPAPAPQEPAEVDAEPHSASSELAPPPERSLQHSRRLGIAGATSLALGLVGFAVMTPYAIRDHRIAREVDQLAGAKEAGGGLTTPKNVERLTALKTESRTTFATALTAGLLGGAASAVGVGLLIAGSRSRARPRAEQLSLSPSLGLDSLGLTLQGRF